MVIFVVFKRLILYKNFGRFTLLPIFLLLFINLYLWSVFVLKCFKPLKVETKSPKVDTKLYLLCFLSNSLPLAFLSSQIFVYLSVSLSLSFLLLSLHYKLFYYRLVKGFDFYVTQCLGPFHCLRFVMYIFL